MMISATGAMAPLPWVALAEIVVTGEWIVVVDRGGLYGSARKDFVIEVTLC